MTNQEWTIFIDQTYRRYINIALRFAQRIEAAEDIVWGVYMNLLQKGYRKEEMAGIGTRSVVNAANNYKSRVMDRMGAEIDEETDCLYTPDVGLGMDVGHIMTNLERTLTGRQHDILMAFVDSGSYTNVAEYLGVKTTTVKNDMHKVRIKVRKEYPEFITQHYGY